MWKIKDPELKAKVNAFFSDEEINNAFAKNTDCYKYFRLSTNINKSCFTFAIDKDLIEFIPDYDPDGWNPFPALRPPRAGNYLVYLGEHYEHKIRMDYYYGPDDYRGWEVYPERNVRAFREIEIEDPGDDIKC